MSSVNTNVGALSVLKTLRATMFEMNTVQNRVSTGLRVSSALDDASVFAVAQGLRGDIKAYNAVSQALGAAKGMAKVALSATTQISNKMQDIQAKIVQLADESISVETRTTYQNDLRAMLEEIETYIKNATYNGVNLISAGATDQTVIASIDGTATVTIRANNLEADRSTLAANYQYDAASAQSALTAGGDFGLFQIAVNNALANLGADIKALEGQDEFIKQVSEAATEGLGSLVDADMAKESAALQALQVRQQLAVQALAIANQAPQTLLRLFG